MADEKICDQCGKDMLVNGYYKRGGEKNPRITCKPSNREWFSEYSKRYEANNEDKVREKNRSHYGNN